MGKHTVKLPQRAWKAMDDYCKKRDAAVISAVRDGDLEPLKQLSRENGQRIPEDKIILISAHKCCCAITTMPPELQERSREWLRVNGYKEEIW